MKNSTNTPAFVTGIALVLAALVFGGFYYGAQGRAASLAGLSVTGSAKTHVTSDQAKVTIGLSRVAAQSAVGTSTAGMAHDLALVTDLLHKKGIQDAAMVVGPVTMNQMYDQNYGSETRYQLNQTVTVQSSDVVKITDISKQVPTLAAQGALVSVQSLEYYYSKLPDLRVSLLADAIKDAKARAEKIAEGTGRMVGDVQSASSGVVQVLAPNSVEVSDYGSYDTSSIDKDVMVTVKATFRLK